jgi:hypothetical protein
LQNSGWVEEELEKNENITSKLKYTQSTWMKLNRVKILQKNKIEYYGGTWHLPVLRDKGRLSREFS